MKRPDHYTFPLAFREELIVDNFAGGGGASTGIEQAIGRHIDIAINHDPEAIAMHAMNHPRTRHYCESVFKVDPEEITGNQPVGLAWFSPDCKHHSKARGGKPRDQSIRGLAWIVIRWARRVKPRVIMLENVEEFQDWGPLCEEGMPIADKKGTTFRLWANQLIRYGYKVEWRQLRACDYGAPTIRKRLFVIARRDGRPIVWPEPTHGDPKSAAVKSGKLLPWRTAAQCIDWSIPCPSIFERKKPLAEATLKRIARGLRKYVLESANPFIVNTANSGTTGRGPNTWDSEEPLRTITSSPGFAVVTPYMAAIGQTGGGHRASSIEDPVRTITSKNEHLLIAPTLVQTGYGEREGQAPRALDLDKPLGTVVAGGQKHALVTAFMAQHNAGFYEGPGRSADEPLSTITQLGTQQNIVTANLVHLGHGEQSASGAKRWSHGIRDIEQPLNTVTASGAPGALVTSHLVKLRNNQFGQSVEEPIPTLTAGGGHVGEVRAFLIKYYSEGGQDQDVREPMHTVPTKDRLGLVTIEGTNYQIVDIGMRMLTPRELYKAQGFPDSYVIEFERNGKPLPKSSQVRMCGNSVCPPLSAALVKANFIHEKQIARAA